MTRYKDEGKCRYGVTVWQCPEAVAENKKMAKVGKVDTESCLLGNCGACPRFIQSVENGIREKKFTVENRHYRKIADQAAYMKENATHKLLFITLTFGKWIDKPITEKNANKCLSNFMDNLKKNYNRGNYIAVRERSDENSKRLHYHCIIELPFVPFASLNRAWCSAISDYCEYSARALTTDREARIIKSTVSVVKYICKYISKCRGQRSESRLIFTSAELSEAQLTENFDGNDLHEVLRDFRSIQVYKCNQWTWRYNISYAKGAKEADKTRAIRAANAFYYQIVMAMFGHHVKKRTELYYFPPDLSV
jgi:hypothetical protein